MENGLDLGKRIVKKDRRGNKKYLKQWVVTKIMQKNAMNCPLYNGGCLLIQA